MQIIYPTQINSMPLPDYVVLIRSRLQELRHGWQDKIPDRIVRSPEKYKCRVGWFASIQLELGNLVNRNLISAGDFKRYSELIAEHNKSLEKRKGNTKEDIEIFNQILDEILTSLEGK